MAYGDGHVEFVSWPKEFVNWGWTIPPTSTLCGGEALGAGGAEGRNGHLADWLAGVYDECLP